MALNAANLGSELETAVRTSQNLDGTPYPELTAYCNAIAQAIVDHFKNNVELDNAKFSGTFPGTVSGATCSTTITDEEVTGGIK
jgi:hypothetical protein